MKRLIALCLMSCALLDAPAAPAPFVPKPIPRLLAIPQPYDQISFQREGQEIARYHYGTNLNRPFLFPLIGPAGAPLTRMGHPRDPVGHSHHNSAWIAHHDVNGVTFWGDRGTNAGRIVHQRLEPLLDDAGDVASVTAHNAWMDRSNRPLLLERRQMVVTLLPRKEYLVVLDLEFTVPKGRGAVTFGATPFGLAAVRMAKSIGVRDGGGRIRNSEGGVDEKGVFWKSAKWVDYSGVSTGSTVEGITLMDHPMNPRHPSAFHVRDDGWMGACLSHGGPVAVEPGRGLRVRYGLYVHAGLPEPAAIETRWNEFTTLSLPEPLKRD
jgi:Methane oxygenase PmoA